MRTIACVALIALALAGGAACGDDEPATDRDFVAELCAATRTLEERLAPAIAAASEETDPARALEALVGPLEEFVDAFREADPPEDLEEWHRDAGRELEEAVEHFKDEKSLAALEGFGDSPVPDPPAEAKARLRSAARDVEECDGVAFLKPD